MKSGYHDAFHTASPISRTIRCVMDSMLFSTAVKLIIESPFLEYAANKRTISTALRHAFTFSTKFPFLNDTPRASVFSACFYRLQIDSVSLRQNRSERLDFRSGRTTKKTRRGGSRIILPSPNIAANAACPRSISFFCSRYDTSCLFKMSCYFSSLTVSFLRPFFLRLLRTSCRSFCHACTKAMRVFSFSLMR